MEKVNYYTDEEKCSIVQEYLRSKESKGSISRKYLLRGHCTLSRWIAKFAETQKDIYKVNKPVKKCQPKSLEEMKILALERQLRDLKLQLEAREIMLDIVKEKTGIDPRKKFGAKQ